MLLKVLLWVGTATTLVAQYISSNVPNQCPQPTQSEPTPSAYYYGHPDDCRYYFQCQFGKPLLMTCVSGNVWSNFFRSCVTYNSHYDTCTRDNAVRVCQQQNGRPLLIPHPLKCHGFYNCSNLTPPSIYSYLGLFEDECNYPDYFDVTSKTCTSFRLAYCGPLRVAEKNPCNYVKNRCGTSHCQPCEDRLPTCERLSDGNHEHPGRGWTISYIVCETERLVRVERCGPHIPTGTVQLFSLVKNQCVPLWEVPRDQNGLAPSCEGKPAGKRRADNRQDVYYECPSGEVAYCEAGSVFNETSSQCEKPS